MDTYGWIGSRHALVIYNQEGKPITDFHLKELLTAEEIAKLPSSSRKGGPLWTQGTRFIFEADTRSTRLVVTLKSRRVVRVSLETGKIIPSSN